MSVLLSVTITGMRPTPTGERTFDADEVSVLRRRGRTLPPWMRVWSPVWTVKFGLSDFQ